jgi:hypothetical protein
MTTSSTANPSLFRRVIDGLRAWEQAMDYTPYDYTLDRVKVVENDLAKLREEARSLEGRVS